VGLERNDTSAYRPDYRNDEHDLARVVTAWPQLPKHIKAAILALIDASEQKSEQPTLTNR
jgi:hypothetical protein